MFGWKWIIEKDQAVCLPTAGPVWGDPNTEEFTVELQHCVAKVDAEAEIKDTKFYRQARSYFARIQYSPGGRLP